MSDRRMLFVDDDADHRNEAAELLTRRGWVVELADEGGRALELLQASAKDSRFDIVVLDLNMPQGLGGEALLERVQDEELPIPPVIVLSGYLDEAARRKCTYLGAHFILEKPYNPANLHEIALAVLSGATQVAPVDFDDGLLDYMVRRRELALVQRLHDVAEGTSIIPPHDEPTLVVARRWNSWYPSVFPIIGGAYAIIGTPSAEGASSGRSPVAVIDPGFQSMRALADLGIGWRDVSSCVVTHNHPDHMGGLFEFMACRHALGQRTKLLCNPACASMLGDCSGYQLEVKEIETSLMDMLPAYQTADAWSRLRLKGFDTAHEEIGRQNSSKGVVVECETGPTKSSLTPIAHLVVLGDTEYNRAEHKDRYLGVICRPNVKVVVLHVGSCQLKQGTGKHLYLPGLRNILSDIDAQLDATQHHGRLLVLISEWGLEHATQSQIAGVCGKSLPGFNRFSPVLETIRYLQKGLKKIQLLPADVGLTVGIHSGEVYLANRRVSPQSVKVSTTDDGLAYTSTAIPPALSV